MLYKIYCIFKMDEAPHNIAIKLISFMLDLVIIVFNIVAFQKHLAPVKFENACKSVQTEEYKSCERCAFGDANNDRSRKFFPKFAPRKVDIGDRPPSPPSRSPVRGFQKTFTNQNLYKPLQDKGCRKKIDLETRNFCNGCYTNYFNRE